MVEQAREEEPGRAARLVMLNPAERRIKMVLERYPLEMPLEAVWDHPQVVKAERLRATRDTAPTRQVVVEIVGVPPDRLDLGPWGRYSLRQYDREPLRCYKCQQYNHLRVRCPHTARCGVCSGRHETDECIRRLKEQQATTARCPNCAQRHHAWHPRCPERLRRMPGAGARRQDGMGRAPRETPTPSFVPAPLPSRPAWGAQAATPDRGLAGLTGRLAPPTRNPPWDGTTYSGAGWSGPLSRRDVTWV